MFSFLRNFGVFKLNTHLLNKVSKQLTESRGFTYTEQISSTLVAFPFLIVLTASLRSLVFHDID